MNQMDMLSRRKAGDEWVRQNREQSMDLNVILLRARFWGRQTCLRRVCVPLSLLSQTGTSCTLEEGLTG